MQAAARPITDWLAGEDVKPVVRISAGTWTANFLCENFVRLWTADDPFTLVLLTTESRLDIAHREIDIGIRAHKPEGANLAGRKTGSVAHARYCARNASSRARESWISILPEETRTDSAQWVNRQKDLRIVAWANTPRTLYDLICASVGSGVLPCFAGDRNSSLERMGPAIADLQQDQWLVMHDEERHRPDVRTVLDRLRHLLEDHAPLFSGKRALGEAG
jgi:DNA-binding transcriptional LysR family regulator